jgi:S1-C subfamily serine protease
MNALLSLSNDLAAAVERAAPAVVVVNARPRLSSTGLHWKTGVVVTADHTVRADDDISIAWPDGRSVPAAVAGRDPGTDLAVLRVDGADQPVAEIADDAALAIGRIVLAIGHGPRASWGVVSAVGGAWRTWRGGEIDRFVRLDLTLYPGFSGGPLIDGDGKVLGVNTSGLSRDLELAIPVSTVSRVVDELLARGRVSRGFLGVGLQPVRLPEHVRPALATAADSGLIVVSVHPEGPAAGAGIVLGDVIVALDGRAVGAPEDVQAVVASRPIGSVLVANVLRAGAPAEIRITVGDRPARRR